MDFLVGPLAQDSSKYIKYANKQMELCISAETDPSVQTRKVFMHYLLNSKDPQTGKGFTRKELNSDSSLLISAGSDTASITLNTTVFYLLHFPQALRKVVREVRHKFNSLDDIRGQKAVDELVYLRACVDEALRLFPPVPSILPREVLPGGLIIEGHHFPQGSIVGVAAYAIHHNKNYFPEPFQFLPERWIAGGEFSADMIATARAAFCPFSLGPRGCTAKGVAYLEVMLTLAYMLFQYDIRLPENNREPSGEGQ
jgi:cytochrome P450